MIHATPGEVQIESTPGLRRAPRQKRSRERVQAILEATATLLETQDYDELTTTSIAERAGMGVSSLYQFFANVDAIVVELVRQWTVEFDRIIVDSYDPHAPLEQSLDAVIDGYVAFFRTAPGFRTVYFSGALRGEARSLDRASNSALESQLTSLWARRIGHEETADLRAAARATVHIADALLGLAFRVDPHGDEGTIAECKRAISLYVADTLTRAG